MTNKIWCQKILIYGLGLIGGSIALKLRENLTNAEIYGIVSREDSLKKAKKLKIVDEVSLDYNKFISDVDFIIFSVSPLTVINILIEIFPKLKQKVFLTDVSSVKGKIYNEIDKFVTENNKIYNKKIVYVGSHPMAGSEKKGCENSDGKMLENATVLVTPFEKTQAKNISLLREFWHCLGAKTKVLSPQDHDLFTAYSSHFMHLISGLTTNLIYEKFEAGNDLKFTLGRSFKEMTRISQSDPKLWTEITLMNRKNLLNILQSYKTNLDKLEKILDPGNEDEIFEFFAAAKKQKLELNEN